MTPPLSFALIGLASVLTLSFTVSEPEAAKAEVSSDGARLLAMASVGVGVGMCNVALPPDIAAKIDGKLASYADTQQDFTQDQYNEQMTRIAVDMGARKAQVCDTIKEMGIEKIYESALQAE